MSARDIMLVCGWIALGLVAAGGVLWVAVSHG